MKLSIVIPYYNTKQYTDQLLSVLEPQINRSVECVLIDDGSDIPFETDYKWVKVFRTDHLGQSHARNYGIEKSKGDYIQFVDSDDLVAEDFTASILKKIKEKPDIIEFSWRSLELRGPQFNYQLRGEGDRLSNPSVCTRTFNRKYIGNVRFNENKDAVEDEEFARTLGYLRYTGLDVSVITDYMYFYRSAADNSNVKRFKQGLLNTKRVVYYYNIVTSDMTDVLESIKEDYKTNEVILLTNKYEIEELENYCQIMRPCNIWTHYKKGESFNGCQMIPVPIESQVMIYVNSLNAVGGIESFLYYFAAVMKKFYDITLIVGAMPPTQKLKIGKHIRVVNYNSSGLYKCDTLIVVRIFDNAPNNITYKKKIQMCHACKTNPTWHINQDTDHIVNVSEVSKASFGVEAESSIVIHNPIEKYTTKALTLISATRIPAADKGNNEKRMITLANMLNKAGIPFVWLVFSDGQLNNPPKGIVNMGPAVDVRPYIAKADYLVQLSDHEAYSYSVLEALSSNTAVIVTPFASVEESGVVDGENGYIVPFDMNFDVEKLKRVPKFQYKQDNDSIVKQWKDLIGESVPRNHYEVVDTGVLVKVKVTYNDLVMNQLLRPGEMYFMQPDRVQTLLQRGFIEVVE